MPAEKKILILNPDTGAGVATAQSLGRRGCLIDTATFHVTYSRRRSRYIRRSFDLPGAGEDAAGKLADLWREERYDLIVPTNEVALRMMLGQAIPAEMYQRAVLPDRQDLMRALDKEAVWQLARELDIRVPNSKLISAECMVPEKFPIVLKPVFSWTCQDEKVKSHSVAIVRNAEEWQAVMKTRFKRIAVQQQEYVAGTGIGVEMLFVHGKPRWAFAHERLHEVPLTGGASSYRISRGLRDDLVQSATRLLSALNWHGVAMVEYKKQQTGECYLMEINPRLWGSLPLSICCGVDFPFGLLCTAVGADPGRQPKYRVGHFARNVSRDLYWFWLNWMADHSDPLLLTHPIAPAVLEWFRPLVGKEHWDFFSWTDPNPIIGEWRRILCEDFVKLLRRMGKRS